MINIKTNWYYFCALANQLQNTTQYVDHATDDNNNLINGRTFSNEFANILMLAASEFEVVCKSLCKEKGVKLAWNANIVSITKGILSACPKIVQTKINTPYMGIIKPLQHWRIESVKNKNGKTEDVVAGIDWWKAHNNVKHDRGQHFSMATLENVIFSMASLMVVEMYLSKEVSGNLDEISSIGCDYFQFEYGIANIATTLEPDLPDYENV